MNALHIAVGAIRQITWSRPGAFAAFLGALALLFGCATHRTTQSLTDYPTYDPLSSSLAGAAIGVTVSPETVRGAPLSSQSAKGLSTVGEVMLKSVGGALYGCATLYLCPAAFVIAPVAAVQDARNANPCPNTKLSESYPDLAREFGAIVEREIPLTELGDLFVAELRNLPGVRAKSFQTSPEESRKPKLPQLLPTASEQDLDYLLLVAASVEPPQRGCGQWKLPVNISSSLWGVEKRVLLGRRWLQHTIVVPLYDIEPLLARPGALRARLDQVFEKAPVRLLTTTDMHVLITTETRIDVGEDPPPPSCPSYGCTP